MQKISFLKMHLTVNIFGQILAISIQYLAKWNIGCPLSFLWQFFIFSDSFQSNTVCFQLSCNPEHFKRECHKRDISWFFPGQHSPATLKYFKEISSSNVKFSLLKTLKNIRFLAFVNKKIEDLIFVPKFFTLLLTNLFVLLQ